MAQWTPAQTGMCAEIDPEISTCKPRGRRAGMTALVRLAYSIVPITGALLAMWVMRDYDVTVERANEIRAQLERRRGEVA
jgi:Na+/melibiose symporter-like transporter